MEKKYFVETHDHVLVDGDFYDGCDCITHNWNFAEAMAFLTHQLFTYNKNGYNIRFDNHSWSAPTEKMLWECETGNGSIVTIAIAEHQDGDIIKPDTEETYNNDAKGIAVRSRLTNVGAAFDSDVRKRWESR